MAAMISFYAFLALIPLALLLLAFVVNVPRDVISAREIEKLFHDVVPGLTQKQFLNTYWNPVRHSKVASTLLGVATLFIGSLGLHDSVDWAVNRIWEASHGRPMWIGKLRGLAIIVWVIAFVALALSLTWGWVQILKLLHAEPLIAAGWPTLVPTFLLDAALFTALYKLTPNCRVDVLPAAIAGTLGAMLWAFSKVAFAWWVTQVGSYNRVYGPLAASVIVMLWIWISASIFLYGAELCAVLQQDRTAAKSEDSAVLPPGRRAG